MKDPRAYLEHILEAIGKIEIALQEFSFKEEFFEEEKWVYREVIFRQLEIIGEAVKNIPDDLRNQYSEIPWRGIAGMRDYLIHEYFAINYDRVWETAKSDIPVLKRQIKDILASLGEEDDTV